MRNAAVFPKSGCHWAPCVLCSTAMWLALIGNAMAAPVDVLSPTARPAGAPQVRQPARSPERWAALTRGLARPLPTGLEFLKDQGDWYTPFNAPGMADRYDLRGLRHTSGNGPATPE